MISKSRQEKQQLGQYFTPPALAGAIWQLLALFRSKGRSRLLEAAGPILEPSVGTGIFLQEGLRQGLPAEAMVGVDVDGSLKDAWQQLRRQHPGLTLVETDALRPHPVLEQPFDVVIGNPPFGSEGLYALREPSSPEAQELAAALSDYSIYRKEGQRKNLKQLATFPIECLFIERSVQLCRPEGWIALILPEGLLSNRRLQHVRSWASRHCALRAIVSLPGDVFRREQANARTVLLLMQKGGRPDTVFMRSAGASDMEGTLAAAEAFLLGQTPPESCLVPQHSLAEERWDPAYWSPELASPLRDLESRFETRPLGDALSFLTYGPIVTGRRPEDEPGEVWLLNQGELGLSGLELSGAHRVAEGSVFDPVRSRPQVGDLLFARSGAGSLGKGRMAILTEPLRANVGCFVDILRFERVDPYFAWLFLASIFGQGQIRRLINGVATPNLSFDEIRALRLPVLPTEVQTELGALYTREVLPLHRAYQAMPAGHPQREAGKRKAHEAMRAAIARFEARLMELGKVPTET
ncbi:MAG TPA: N-6 DNA methylase [Stenomitos sp.]